MKEENDVIIQPKERRKKSASSLFGIVFLVWFIGSIILMLNFFGKEQVHYGIMMFGQYFLVFGLIPLFGS